MLAMFLFGLSLSLGMVVYWRMNLAEFYPLQKALADEFPKCTPRIDAGRLKNQPLMLRVILQVPEQPRKESPRVRQVLDRTVELVRQHTSLEKFGTVHIYLVHREPEKETTSLHSEYAAEGVLRGAAEPQFKESP